MSSPAVTIIMPARNAARTIAEAVESVTAQTFADWRLLIVDDASTDETAEIVQAFASHDSRIAFISLSENRGVAGARNAALEMVSSPYCAFLDSDDIWHTQKLERQLVAMSGGYQMCCTSYGYISETGRKLRGMASIPHRCDMSRLLRNNFIGCSTVMVETSALAGHMFPEDCPHEDYALWLDLFAAGVRCVGIPEPLVEHRKRRGSVSSNKLKSATGRWAIYRKRLGLPMISALLFFISYGAIAVYKHFVSGAGR